MIDFHNHVLPNVDDGPKSIEESISMIKCAVKQGITDVVQTVHYQHPKMDGKNINYEHLKKKTFNLQSIINEHKLDIKIHLSAEVFYLPNLIDIMNENFFTFNKKKFMLIEFSSTIFPQNYKVEIYKIQNKGVVPIIAHPERYRFVKNNLNEINDWLTKDYILQLDAGSVLGFFGKITQKISYEIIENYGIHLIGSDAHNNKKRNFCLLDAYNHLEKKYDIEFVKKLKKNAEFLLMGQNLELNQVKQKNSILNEIKSKLFTT